MPLDDLPDWLPARCRDHLSAEPAGVLFGPQQRSMVVRAPVGRRRDVAVKARGDGGRTVSCVAAQPGWPTMGFRALDR